MKEQDIDILLTQIRTIILNKPLTAALKSTSAELADLQEAISYLADCLTESNAFLKNLSVGNLDAKAPNRYNFLAAGLKELHAGLRHMTWQADQVANGDYQQKVSFLGDFSDSFNKMVAQLEERENKLRSQADALTKSMSLMIAIMDGLSNWVIVTEKDTGDVLYANHASNQYFYNANTGTTVCGKENCEFMQSLRNCSGDESHLEFTCGVNGRTLYAKTFALQWNEKLAYAHFIADITDAKEEKEKLESLAFQDELTGLYNRRYGLKKLEQLIMDRKGFTTCLIDLDGLKVVNDTLGHLIGDEYITTVAHAMKRLESDSGIVCRVGGDEFIFILPERNEAMGRHLMRQLDKILAKIKRSYTLAISYGIVYVSKDTDITAEAVLKQVDDKMYFAKREKKQSQKG
ncbi:MAG: diguanylate cyclase [Evtepia sp.]